MDNFVFQIDHPSVRSEYAGDNYKIVFDETQPKDYCALYFSSHSIYFPNEEAVFNRRIRDKDAYEWFKTRVDFAHKHIFMRDIFKQWYLAGLNSTIDSPEKLLAFLKGQTRGYKVIAIGASAGGYAAVLYGSLLGAERVLSFNGQMELNSQLDRSSPSIDPLIFRMQETPLRNYYDLKPFIRQDVRVYYFYSLHSEWDARQASHIADAPVHFIKFNVSKHGIPFLKCSLPEVIGFTKKQLDELVGPLHNPFIFSIKTSGYKRVSNYCSVLLWQILSGILLKKVRLRKI